MRRHASREAADHGGHGDSGRIQRRVRVLHREAQTAGTGRRKSGPSKGPRQPTMQGPLLRSPAAARTLAQTAAGRPVHHCKAQCTVVSRQLWEAGSCEQAIRYTM